MKMSTKNLLIILVVLVVAFAAVQMTKRKGKSKSLRTELVAMDTSKVSKIEVVSPGETVILSKSETGWEVDVPLVGQKKANQKSITSLLNMLSSIEPGRLAARSEDKWKDYAVDSTGTRIKVYEGDELSNDIVVGRFGMEGQRSFYSFVRLFDEPNVYVANDFMGMSIGKKPADYRNGELMRLKKDSLTSISFDYPDSAFTLVKSERWLLDDQPADSIAVANYLSGLGYLNSKSFFDEGLPDIPTHKITFSFSNRDDITLEGFAMEDKMIVSSSENMTEAFSDEKVITKAFKGKGAFAATSD